MKSVFSGREKSGFVAALPFEFFAFDCLPFDCLPFDYLPFDCLHFLAMPFFAMPLGLAGIVVLLGV